MEPSPQSRREAIVSLFTEEETEDSQFWPRCLLLCHQGGGRHPELVFLEPQAGPAGPSGAPGRTPSSTLVVLVQAPCTFDGDVGLRSAPEINSLCGEHGALSVTGPSSQLGDLACFFNKRFSNSRISRPARGL